MVRFIYIAFLTLIVGTALPTKTYACNTTSNKTEELTKKTLQKKDCCKKEKENGSNKDNDCERKCNNPACHCPISCVNFILPVYNQLLLIKTIVSKSDFYFQETYYSSRFLTIWQPPKIG